MKEEKKKQCWKIGLLRRQTTPVLKTYERVLYRNTLFVCNMKKKIA